MLSQIFNFVSFIGAVQGVLLAGFLFTRKERNPATFFLAAYVFIFSLGLLEPFAAESLQGPLRIPVLTFLASSNFLYGPFLFLFVARLEPSSAVRQPRIFAHAIPFALVFLFELFYAYTGQPFNDHDLFLFFAFEVLVLHILSYNVSAIRILARRRRHSLTSDGQNAAWLQSLLKFITAIYLLSFIITHLKIFGVPTVDQYYLAVQILITVLIYTMTYMLILSPGLFTRPYSVLGAKHGATKYARSGLKDDQAKQYLDMLSACMIKEKPYLNADVSIHSLAQQIGISKNHLTQVLNERLSSNFYEYMNRHRVEEAKRLMNHPAYAHLTLTGIGLEAGFKSRTAFNQNFKKLTGFTPTDWKRHVDSVAKVSDPGGRL